MSTAPTIRRDEELGAALRELDVPEHRPGFERELGRLLAAERLAGHGRLPARRFRSRVRRWTPRAALAFAAIAVAVAALVVPRLGGTEVASASEIKAQVRASLGSLETLSGVLVSRCSEEGCPGKAGERRWRFVIRVSGDFRLFGPEAGETVTYDASAGVVRMAGRSASVGGDTIFYAERRGVAPGPPDLGPPTWLSMDEFGAFVRSLLGAGDPRVEEVVYGDRPAWRLEADSVPNAIVPDFTGDRFRITVDRATGIPVRVAELKQGVLLRELRVERLAVDERPAPGAFRLEFPPDVEVARTDDGFRPVSLADVAGVVGYAPLVPAWVPEGYELAEVAVAREAGPTGTEAGNPPSRMVVSLSYRRGFDQLVVTSRLARTPAGGGWSDPLATGEGYVDQPERITIEAGALRSRVAELLIAPRGIPHVWALAGDLVITVAGDLGRAELVRVAGSLERRP